jgi:hypothetical protein
MDEEKRRAAAKAALRDAERLDQTGAPASVAAANDLAQRTMRTMSNKEIEELDGIKNGVDVLVRNLSPEQFAGLMKSDKLTESEKNGIRNVRFEPIATAVASGNRDVIRGSSNKDLEQLASSQAHSNLLADNNFAAMLSQDQYDYLQKSSNLTDSQRGSLKTARDSRFDPGRVATTIPDMSPDDIGKIAPNILMQPHVFPVLDIEGFAAVMRANKLTNAQRQQVGQHIEHVLTTPGAPRHAEYTNLWNSLDPNTKARMTSWYQM